MKPVSIFLMAHQDDEFGIFHQIEYELRIGRRVRCVYITDGAATANPECRNRESRAVLQKLGIVDEDIFFIGQQLSIGDGQLHCHVEACIAWLAGFFEKNAMTQAYFIPAWEGGHPDHDLLHAITVELLMAQQKLPPSIWQYSLYNNKNCFGPFFRVMSPLPENGQITRQLITLRDRLRYISLCLFYRSQWRSWLGLFPFICWHYLAKGAQELQPVSRKRLTEPPHQRPLYYEYRAFLDWPTLSLSVGRLHQELSRMYPETFSTECK